MEERFIEDSSTVYVFDRELETPNYLAENYPIHVTFYPTTEILRKLIMRMTQIKNPDKDLW